MLLSSVKPLESAITLVELDDLDQLYSRFGLINDDLAPLRSLLLRVLSKVVSQAVSGVILSSREESLRLASTRNQKAGVIFSLEDKTSTFLAKEMTRLTQNWSVEHVRGNYGLACLEIFYNPSESLSMRKKQLVSEIYQSCKHEGIDFLLKLIVYQLDKNKHDHQQSDDSQLLHQDSSQLSMFETQFASINELRQFCDLLALEYFEDPLHAATITTQLDVPWLVFERNVEYQVAKQTIRTGMENGASGFVISDILWHDFLDNMQAVTPTPIVIEQYVNTVVKDRLLELVRIANELYCAHNKSADN